MVILIVTVLKWWGGIKFVSFKWWQKFMVELMTHQNSVGNALQEGNHLIMDGKVNDEEEGEIREQMTLLNSRWESLRLSAMERQSLWVDATAICINGTMDIAWIYICGTLNVTWICICGTADMTWFCIVGQWVWHECAKWWNINMTWACLFIIYFLGSLVLHSWLLSDGCQTGTSKKQTNKRN